MMGSRPCSPCCREMDDAFEEGTDNEEWGALAVVVDRELIDLQFYPLEDEGRIFFGSDLRKISFCPWCGSKVKKLKPSDLKRS